MLSTTLDNTWEEDSEVDFKNGLKFFARQHSLIVNAIDSL